MIKGLLLIAYLIASLIIAALFRMVYLSTAWRFEVHKFKPGLYIRKYSVLGSRFTEKKLDGEWLILERRGRYVLVQDINHRSIKPLEKDIKAFCTYSDIGELTDADGNVIAQFRYKIF